MENSGQPLPTYEQATTAAAVAGEVQQERESGVIDRQYIKGIPGLLKLVQVSFSLIAFICVTASAVVCAPWIAVTGYFSFVSMAAVVLTLILYVILLLKLQKRIFSCECCRWPLIEAGFYGGLLIFYFFADLFLSIQGCVAGHKAAVAFGWIALFAYGVDGFFAGRNLLQWRRERSGSVKEVTDQEIQRH